MGTTYNVKFVSNDGINEKDLKLQITQVLIDINQLMSTYIQDSELSRFNQWQSIEPFVMSPQTLTVLSEAKRLGEISDGILDVTIGPLVNLWGFGPQQRPEKIPSDATIQSIKQQIGLDKLTVGPASATKSHPELYVDLSTIAKGYAVDRGMNILLEHGLSAGLVNAGGDSRIMGDRGRNAETGQKIPWVIGVRHPRDKTKYALRLPLSDTAISTSGDYERFFIDGNERVHHILNPSTGQSASGMASATVIGAQSILCDALATTVFASGVEKGLALIERFEGYDAVIIDLDGKVHYSAGFVAN